MRCVYEPETEAFWLRHYMKGGDLPAYMGIPYQRGGGIGSIFKSIFRFILPFAKKVAPTIAKEAFEVGSEIANKHSRGEDWKKPAKKGAKKIGGVALEHLGKHLQSGGAIGKRKRKLIRRAKTLDELQGILRKCRNK